jgi:chromosome segregation protein
MGLAQRDPARLVGWRRRPLIPAASPRSQIAIATVENNKLLAEASLAALENGEPEASSGDLARQVRDLDALVRLGRNLGLHDGHCPLCASNITHSEFEKGLVIAAFL